MRAWIGAAAIIGLAAAAAVRADVPAAAPARGLPAFASEAELLAFLRAHPGPERAACCGEGDASGADVVVTGSRVESITNNQEAGVDEGGIVKLAGDVLVILRRGRLFTVSLAGGRMRAVDRIDAFPPGTTGDGWYDEMLVHGTSVIVVGYSYARGGTEINRFRLLPGGRLRFEDAYQLRSNDYYSSRNYASRLIGAQLVFYTPLDMGTAADPLGGLPALRRWRGEDGEEEAFRPIAGPRQVYVPPILRDGRGAIINTLHTVTRCDLDAPALDCRATVVAGAGSRSFYVSGQAVYLWIGDAWDARPERRGAGGFLYRVPLEGGVPSAAAVRGGPVDQFSFREAGGTLDVLVRSEGGDDRMWRPEVSSGDVALLRVPLASLGDGSAEVPLARYRPLPRPVDDGWSFHNRFVGDHLLYGASGERGTGLAIYVAPVAGGETRRLPLGHDVDRIEALGDDAVVIGRAGGDLGFAAVELARRPRVGDRYVLPGAAEGESRSHGFFFRPDPRAPGGASGTLGLPVLRGRAAAMLFLRRDARRFAPAGEVSARPVRDRDDDCEASCVDWYGNARPIFVGTRVFALMGYELVEGALVDGAVRERARIDFGPRGRRRG